MKSYQLYFFFIISVIMASCKNDGTGTSTEGTNTTSQNVPVPRFDRDSAFAFIEKQLSFGPRVPGSEGHQQCKDWMVKKLKEFGANVIEQDFEATFYTGKKVASTNVIGQFNPQSNQRIVLAAHWDTRHIADSPLSTARQDEPVMGADDGGSGVGVLLEVARALGQNPIDIGVDIVFFDAEDHGKDIEDGVQLTTEEARANQKTWAIGAQYWSNNLHIAKNSVKYGILLDMVGAEGARFPKEGYSLRFARPIVNKVWKLAQNMGYGNYFVNQEDQGGVTDDHFFVNTIAGIPMIDIIHKPASTPTGFGSHWHTHNDDIHIIDKRTLRAVGQLVLAVVYRENNGQM